MFKKLWQILARKKDRNYKRELYAMSDKEIEKVIQKAFALIKEDRPSEWKELFLKVEKLVEDEELIMTDFTLFFSIRKKGLSSIFATCPNAMAKKIDEASKLFVTDLPPVFLEFAKRWKEEKAR